MTVIDQKFLKTVCFILLFGVTGLSQGRELFSDSTVAPSLKTSSHWKRYRAILVDDSAFEDLRSHARTRGSKSGLHLSLFSGVEGNFILDKPRFKTNGAMVLTGHLDGVKQSLAILSYNHGALSGYVLYPNKGIFLIRYAGNGTHQVYEENLEGEKICATEGDLAEPATLIQKSMAQPGYPFLIPQNQPMGCNYSATPYTKNLIVLYDADAAVSAGGTVAIESVIDEAVAYFNAALYNSQINIQMNLVFSGPIAYTETGNSQTDLFNLAGNSYANSLITTYGGGSAKVCMLIGSGTAAGIAFNPGSYSVVEESAAVGVIAHEVGHNFGCHHDRITDGVPPGDGNYYYGWQWAAEGVTYHTVMAYAHSYNDYTVPYYSNPNVSYLGIPTGVVDTDPYAADNAHRWSQSATSSDPAAGFPTVSLTSPVEGSVFSTATTITLNASANEASGTIAQVDFYADDVYQGTATTAPYSFAWALPPSGSHYLSATAIDANGAMGYSCPVSVTINSSLPLPWQDQYVDLGVNTAYPGSASAVGNLFTVSGGGGGIEWFPRGYGDGFQYTYQPFCGDGTIQAQVVAADPTTGGSSQAGLMFREDLNWYSAYASIYFWPNGGGAPAGQGLPVFTWRDTTGDDNTQYTYGGFYCAYPYWLKLTRAGAVFTGAVSPDGTTWTTVGSGTLTGLGSSIESGLAVSSYATTILCTAQFNNPSVSMACVPPTMTPTYTCTNTATKTATNSPTNTATNTATNSATSSSTGTSTSSPTASDTNTSTNTATASATQSPTETSTSSPTASCTNTATNSATATATNSATNTATNSSTNTATNSATETATNSATNSATNTATSSATQSPTGTSTSSPTASCTNTATNSVTATATNSATNTATPTSTLSATNTATNSSTNTATNSATETATNTVTNTFTNTPINTYTFTQTATNTSTNTVTNTVTNTATNTATHTSTNTSTNTATNTATSTATNTSTNTATNSATSTSTNTYTLTYTATSTNTSTVTGTFTPTFTYTFTSTVTNSATASPTVTATSTSTSSPTITFTSTITLTPTITPTPTITGTPTMTFTPTATVNASFYLSANLFKSLSDGPLMIHYGVLNGGAVEVAVYDVTGQKVRELVNVSQGVGTYLAAWDGKDDRGNNSASGIYLVSISEPSHRQLLKVLVLK